MDKVLPVLPEAPETVAELRDLYRSAEARAARLRLLLDAGRDLAAADGTSLADTLDQWARRLAHFLGRTEGTVKTVLDWSQSHRHQGIALPAPGGSGRRVGTLVIAGISSADDVADRDDRDACLMLAQLMGTAIDRAMHEAEQGRLLAALTERESQLEQLVSSLFSVQEEERRRVSRDLHDGVAQTAAALFRGIEAARCSAGERQETRQELDRLAAIARDLVQELRVVIAGLRPTVLDDLGLDAALHALADALRDDGYTVHLAGIENHGRWPAYLETVFFRVAQEAVTNIRKHAGGPCVVDITLARAPADDGWQLQVRDHGTGFCPPAASNGPDPAGAHIGIEVMRERMAAIGGALNVESDAGGGVLVTACIGGAAAGGYR